MGKNQAILDKAKLIQPNVTVSNVKLPVSKKSLSRALKLTPNPPKIGAKATKKRVLKKTKRLLQAVAAKTKVAQEIKTSIDNIVNETYTLEKYENWKIQASGCFNQLS